MILIIQIRSPDAKSRDFYTRKQCFRCFRFISKHRCTVQGALWAKSTTSETELFPILPWSAVISKQKGRAPAVEGIGNCADALSWFGTRRLSTWAPRVVFVWKPHWRPLQGQTSQRRCWSCLWGVPRFLFKNKYSIFQIEKMSPSWFSVIAGLPWFSAVEMAAGMNLYFGFGLVILVTTWLARFALVNLVIRSFNTASCSTLDRTSVRQQRIWILENKMWILDSKMWKCEYWKTKCEIGNAVSK